LPALVAVVLDWGVVVEAAFVLAYSLYFVQVSVLMTVMQVGGIGCFALSALATEQLSDDRDLSNGCKH
jgi:hypothetical protein